MRLSQTAKKVIALATTIREYWETELPKRHPDYPLVHPGEDSGRPPLQEKRLRDLLAKLPEDDVYKLALIMQLGRGDFGTDVLAEEYEALKETFGDRESATAQLLEKASLADYLESGLAELKASGLDPDRLCVETVGSSR